MHQRFFTLGTLVLALSTPARAELFLDFNNQSDAGLTPYNPLAPFGQGEATASRSFRQATSAIN